MAKDKIIELEGVDFYYDKGKPTEVHALKEINIEVEQGDYISFFGPSGCGKTTLLYVISGIERPGRGKVVINGRDLMEFDQQQLAVYRQIGIGIIFQNFNLIPSLKIIDNIALPMTFLGISPERRKKRAMFLLERLGIADLANRLPFELSGGQQQRVGIARALANDPPIILADEPIGNLDSVNAENVLDLLKEFNEKDGRTIIMVTHEAWSLRDVNEIFYMRDGEVKKRERRRKRLGSKKVKGSYYYKSLFPELTSEAARARILSFYLLRGYSREQIKRMEYFLLHLFKGAIGIDLFRRILDRPFAAGGVGLWKQKAAKIAGYAERIMKEQGILKRAYKEIEKNPETPLAEEARQTKEWLLEGFKVKLTPLQSDRMEEIISERMRNIITAEHFRRLLDLSVARGGVGLRIGTSFKMAEKMEVILGNPEKEDGAQEDTIIESDSVKEILGKAPSAEALGKGNDLPQ